MTSNSSIIDARSVQCFFFTLNIHKVSNLPLAYIRREDNHSLLLPDNLLKFL